MRRVRAEKGEEKEESKAEAKANDECWSGGDRKSEAYITLFVL